MICISTENAQGILQALINKQLCYGIKSPDLDLYDFGFSNLLVSSGLQETTTALFLHATCSFKVISKVGACRTDVYTADTASEKFHSDIANLIGLTIKRVSLSSKNDLWLDFGDYWMVFITFEDEDESWRFFSNCTKHHLVVSALNIYLA